MHSHQDASVMPTDLERGRSSSRLCSHQRIARPFPDASATPTKRFRPAYRRLSASHLI